jgi:copper ion binding protein
MKQVFEVQGMTCGHCVNSVTSEIKKIDGVSDVSVDLVTGKVDVTSDQELIKSEVAAAIEEAGYELVG